MLHITTEDANNTGAFTKDSGALLISDYWEGDHRAKAEKQPLRPCGMEPSWRTDTKGPFGISGVQHGLGPGATESLERQPAQPQEDHGGGAVDPDVQLFRTTLDLLKPGAGDLSRVIQSHRVLKRSGKHADAPSHGTTFPNCEPSME